MQTELSGWGSVGPVESGQNGAITSPSPPFKSLNCPTVPFPSPPPHPHLFSLSPLGIFHQLESKDISCHTDGKSRTSALGHGYTWVAMDLPVDPTTARVAFSSCSGNVPPACSVLLRPSPPHSLLSAHKFLALELKYLDQ